MKNVLTEKLTARLIALTLSAVTIVVFTASVTDPVNVTKLFVLGGLTFAAFGAGARLFSFSFLKTHKISIILLIFFLFFSISTLLTSKAPFSQSFYGVYGRNNGFLLYLLLTLLFLTTLTVETAPLFKRYLFALLVSGLVNLVYAIWVFAFGDFVGWNNQYGNLLGTFGNPNFIGAFFGMFSALLFTVAVSRKFSRRDRVSSSFLLPVVLLGIVETHAVQGRVLFVFGAAIVIFYWLRDRFASKMMAISYLGLSGLFFTTALLGTLQKGPLASLLYKESVSLRGQYWHAGWATGLNNPIFGAGFDSYGDWYRRSRRESALSIPGVDTVSNTAHNVFLDLFAFGGWPLLISYILLFILVLVAIVKFTIRNKEFDPIFVAMTSVWACYQLQSTISINQVGLAIWGWVFGAALVAYERLDKDKKSGTQSAVKSLVNSRNQKIRHSQNSVISPGLTAGIAALIGLLLAVPPLSADMKWRSAQSTRDASRFGAILSSNYMNPINMYELNSIVGVFETSGLIDQAHKYGLQAVKINPDNYEAWRNLYQLSKTTEMERNRAIQNMKRLDPLNPTIGKLP